MRCHYCEKDFPADCELQHCNHCGMALPAATNQQGQLQKFRWWVLAIGIFCLIMIVWLPRHISG